MRSGAGECCALLVRAAITRRPALRTHHPRRPTPRRVSRQRSALRRASVTALSAAPGARPTGGPPNSPLATPHAAPRLPRNPSALRRASATALPAAPGSRPTARPPNYHSRRPTPRRVSRQPECARPRVDNRLPGHPRSSPAGAALRISPLATPHAAPPLPANPSALRRASATALPAAPGSRPTAGAPNSSVATPTPRRVPRQPECAPPRVSNRVARRPRISPDGRRSELISRDTPRRAASPANPSALRRPSITGSPRRGPRNAKPAPEVTGPESRPAGAR